MHLSHHLGTVTTGVIVGVTVLALGATTPALAAVEQEQAQLTVDELFRIQPYHASASYNGGAQTVTVGADGALAALDLYLARADFTTKSLIVEIRDGAPDGTLLATSDPLPAADVPVNPTGDWIGIAFSAPPALSAGQVIAIVIPYEPMSDSPDPAWYWGKASSDVYAGGVAWGGAPGVGWDDYDDGSDLAFVTFVDVSDTCDLAVAAEGGDWVDDTLNVMVGDTTFVAGFDFPPNAGVTIELVSPGGNASFLTDTTDATGHFEGSILWETGDEGIWNLYAYPTTDDTCNDTLNVVVAAAAATQTSSTASAAATPVPTPTPAASSAALPDTAASNGNLGSLVTVLAIVLLGLALAARISGGRSKPPAIDLQ